MPAATETLDATGMHVLPGAIDVHVHFRDPGYAHKEDFGSGTAAAAFGGVTTVFDMPNTIPTVANAEVLTAKHKLASEKAYVDYGLYAVLGEESLEHIDELVEAGIIGFTRTIARELASRGVTVNAVAPGFIITDMTDVLPEKIKTEVKERVPVRRLGNPEDIADLVCYLAGPGASYLTGQVIAVDGGMTA